MGGGGDPFDFAQGRLFAPPEKRLRSGGHLFEKHFDLQNLA
jgi:hypothetical protein